MDIKQTTLEIDAYIKKELKSHRYEHCVRTAQFAHKYALLHNLDTDKAYCAGLSHDIGKEFSVETLEQILHEDHYILPNNLPHTNEMLHGIAGSIFLKNKFHVDDEDILEAVFCHTVPHFSMGNLAKLIYAADKIEPNRKHIDNDFRQNAFTKTPNELFLYTFNHMINYLLESKKEVYSETLKMYVELQKV